MRAPTLGLLILAALAACAAPDDFAEGVGWFSERDGEHDARARPVDDRPFLRFDDLLLWRIRRLAQGEPVPGDRREELASVLERGAALGLEITGFEIDRLADATLEEVHEKYLAPEGRAWPGAAAFRAETRERFAAESARWLAAELAAVRAFDEEGVRRYAEALEDDVDDGIKEASRFLRVLAHLYVAPVSMVAVDAIRSGEYWGPKPVDEDFRRVRVLEPALDGTDGDDAMDLLRRHAPVIVQQLPEGPTSYAETADRIGTVCLTRGEDGAVSGHVDTAAPCLYGHTGTAIVRGRELRQLVYTLFYPEHPALKSPDYEAGKIEAIILRVTLDAAGRPALFESLYACGCHHRLRVAPHLARAAPPVEGHHPLERWEGGALAGLHVVEEVPEEEGPGARLVLYQYAGFHMTGAVRITGAPLPPGAALDGTASYVLRRYEDLEHQPAGARCASLFDGDGLVVGAERGESFWLAGAGFFAAGQPRQRGTHRILLDEEDFDDPTLLDRLLRLPDAILAAPEGAVLQP